MSTMVREIFTLQRQWRELGRIRMGNQVAASNGRKRPNKLTTFRVTSVSEELIAAVAIEYGGTVQPWKNGEVASFEVVIESTGLDILVPPGQVLSQSYELWKGGGCERRCDGIREVISGSECLCPVDPAQRMELAGKGMACKPTSRLNVILPKIPDLGVWRLESHGYYAAVELAGTVDLLKVATARGLVVPARLRLDQRTVKRIGQAPKHFAVPVVELPTTTVEAFLTAPMAPVAQITGGAAPAISVAQPARAALEAGAAPAEAYVPVTPAATPEPPSWGDEPELPEFAEPIPTPAADLDFGAAPEIVDLAKALTDRWTDHPNDEPATKQQREALNDLLKPLGAVPARVVLRHVFGLEDFAAITGGMAEALLDESEPDEALFRLRFANLAEQLRKETTA